MLTAERMVRRYVLEEAERLATAEGRATTFVQIGANDGVTDDPLTKFVKENGWEGILVEPLSAAFTALKANYGASPRLRFVQAAISETDGRTTIYTSANSRLASLDKAKASQGGKESVTKEEVTVLSPRTLFKTHGIDRVDVLVVDAEGFDGRILRAIDFSTFSASVIVWESHKMGKDATATADYLRRAGFAVVPMRADSVAVRKDLVRFDARLANLLERLVAQDVKTSREMKLLRQTVETGGGTDPFAPRVTATEAVTEPRGPASAAVQPLRKWYFSVNEGGLTNAFEDVAVSVLSAREKTSLQPVCLYVGADHPRLAWLEANGVTVIRHTLSVEASIQAGYGEDAPKFTGHWARVDVADVETEDTYVLYTDIDVMFRRDPAEWDFRPPYVSVVEEKTLGDRHHFNSGAMVINVPAVRAVLPWFRAAIDRRLNGVFQYPPHDQASFNEFFKPVASWMDPIFNWKPYWGWNEEAAIIHFHGPKPRHVARFGPLAVVKPSYRTLHKMSPETYKRLDGEYRRYLTAAER
jgi:FkbM family methyltransferase